MVAQPTYNIQRRAVLEEQQEETVKPGTSLDFLLLALLFAAHRCKRWTTLRLLLFIQHSQDNRGINKISQKLSFFFRRKILYTNNKLTGVKK